MCTICFPLQNVLIRNISCVEQWILILIISCIVYSSSSDFDGFNKDPNYICEARCLGNMKREVGGKLAQDLKSEPHLSKPICLGNNSNCIACAEACGTYGHNFNVFCRNKCQKFSTNSEKKACTESCEFLEQVYKNPPQGNCPPLKSDVNSVNCGRLPSCQSEHDCPTFSKLRCCSTSGCPTLMTCQKMVQLGVPPVPDMKITLKEIKNEHDKLESHILIDWSNFDFTKVEQPVLFRLQLRSSEKREFLRQSAWNDLLITSKTESDISSFFVGMWYQFRLWSYSELGSDGPGPHSDAIYIPNKNLTLSKPRNLHERLVRIIGDRVDVTIMWDRPSDHNKMIHGYMIRWVEILGESVASFRKNAAKVPPNTNIYTMKNLKLSSKYKVKVKALVDNNKSKAASIYINTMERPTAQPRTGYESINQIVSKDGCRCGINLNAPVDIQKATMRNDDLQAPLEFKNLPHKPENSKVELEWEPKVCISNNLNSFGLLSNYDSQSLLQARAITASNYKATYYLSNLQFHCHYRLSIRQYSFDGVLARQWSTCFCTPSCQSIKIQKPDNFPNCKSFDSLIPDRPDDLKVDVGTQSYPSPYVENKTNMPHQLYQATISWKYPRRQHLIKGYRIIWGPRIEEPIDTKMYNYGISPQLNSKAAQQKVLDGPHHYAFHVLDLLPGTLYIIKIQAIGDTGDSETQTIFFTTPDKEKNSAQSVVKFSLTRQLVFLFIFQFTLLHLIHS